MIMKFRKIVVDNVTWYWFAGKSSAVIKFPEPSGKKQIVSYAQLTGRSWETLEKGLHKKNEDGMITPGDVSKYIRNNLQQK